WVAAPPAAPQRLRELGIAVYGAGERAVEAAAALARYHAGRPAAAEPTAAAAPCPPGLDPRRDGMVPSVQATAWLQAAGIPMAPVALARDGDAAGAAWRGCGRAVALKIESRGIARKSEVGGALRKLDDAAAAGRGQPRAAGPRGRVVGVQRDPVGGARVMAGSGGVLVEVLKDVAFRRAPFDVDTGLAMLDELRMGALLDGVRGQPAVDRRAVARLLSDLSRWAAATPRLAELDLNPVRVGPAGPVAVDCVMVLRDPQA